MTELDILAVWEAGQGRSPVERALLLLAEASPEESWDDLAALPIGRRDGRLLALREALFGDEFVSLTACPECGAELQLSFGADDIRIEAAAPPNELSATVSRHEIRFRLPNSLDLAALADEEEPKTAALRLLERCLLAARHEGQARTAAELPADVVEEIALLMEKADPQADARTSLSCPSCQHRWESIFDIGSFLWSEIEAWALRTLRDVHTLASAYGWSESQVLSVSPWRRRLYLECVGQ